MLEEAKLEGNINSIMVAQRKLDAAQAIQLSQPSAHARGPLLNTDLNPNPTLRRPYTVGMAT